MLEVVFILATELTSMPILFYLLNTVYRVMRPCEINNALYICFSDTGLLIKRPPEMITLTNLQILEKIL